MGLRRRLGVAGMAVVLVMSVGACDPFGGGDKPVDVAADCSSRHSLTRALLPDGRESYGERYQATINPCLEFLDLVSTVLQLVPEAERRQAKKFDTFLDKLTKVANRLSDLKDVVQCGYQRDHLAIGLYQGATIKWSIGVVIVIRGDIDAFLNVAACFVDKLIRDYICPGCGGGEDDVKTEIRPCFDYANPTRDGERYTVLWVASTNTLCTDMQVWLGGMDDDEKDLQQAEVRARPRLVIRSGPGQSFERKGAVPYGTTVYLQCYVLGETVTGIGGDQTDQWDLITLDGITGYVSHAWLHTSGRTDGSDNPATGWQLPECASG